jgi:uncharacterized protein YdhG (YjbR/CyaY superfamily)
MCRGMAAALAIRVTRSDVDVRRTHRPGDIARRGGGYRQVEMVWFPPPHAPPLAPPRYQRWHTRRMAARDIDRYLAGVGEPMRSTLQQLRQCVLDVIPDAEECISYGLPAFKIQGKAIAGFGAFKNHLSYLPHSGSVLPALAADLAGYEGTKGSLHFPLDQPLPAALVHKLVTTRLRELGMWFFR